MANLPSFLFFSILMAQSITTSAEFNCAITSCENGGLPIQFPFSLRQANQGYLCGYPGFDLSCTNTNNSTTLSEPLLTLPESGDFVVKLISLQDQKVWINDPDNCLPKRIMRDRGLNLKGSPFQFSDYYTLVNFSFLSCPSNLTSSSLVQPITCLNSSSYHNNLSYSVVAIMSDPPFPTPWTSSCLFISSASIPVQYTPWLFWTDYYADIPLKWDYPGCGSCVARGGRCGFLGDPAFDVTCYDLPTQGSLTQP
ncbi:Wall-associated receptor kinase, galacturonan-binding domain [Sesbania bispinosa]|nr:Wall-associated receptor kinase, galacturonan-binding domain [Sesbania bispinosa]